jgi:enoyl-CoA hydratase/carnithine racemase
MADLLTLETLDDGAIRVCTLNRPDKRNALSIALRDELSDTLDQWSHDPALRVVVLTGGPDVFSAGFDLREFDTAFADEELAARLWASSDRYHHRVLSFPLPIVAAVSGFALAGGFDLAVLCDVRVVSTTATFAHPERTFAEVVYGPLRELVGGGPARDLMLTGRTIDAEEALRLGLASAIVEPGALLDTAIDTARQIAAAPREILIKNKAKILRFAGVDAEQATLDL